MLEDDIPYYLSEGDVTLYEKIYDTRTKVVFDSYYLKRVKALNSLISDLNSLKKLET